jgi:uncharacterized protein (TIGR00290 family)
MKLAVLWTGGKDSALAAYLVSTMGHSVASLITFVPPRPEFHAHDLSMMRLQASAMGLPHECVEVREPYEDGYTAALKSFKDRGIQGIVTGDIDLVDGLPNWICELSRPIGLPTIMPLWKQDRRFLLQTLLELKFKVVISYGKKTMADFVGRELDWKLYDDLLEQNGWHGVDVCGENGEYHSMVLGGPTFRGTICLDYEVALHGDDKFIRIRSARLVQEGARGSRMECSKSTSSRPVSQCASS